MNSHFLRDPERTAERKANKTELDYSTICKEIRITKLAVARNETEAGKAGAWWRAENARRTLRACFFGYSKFDGAPTAGPPPATCVYQRRRETRWGEPVSTTKTPSRLTARNYDYRRVLEYAWCVPWLSLSLSLSPFFSSSRSLSSRKISLRNAHGRSITAPPR